MVADDVQVCIVGGGVGGLALAGFLRRAGVEPVVVERSSEWDAPADRGMILPGEALSVLDSLGVGEDVRATGRGVAAWTLRDPDGTVRDRLETTAAAIPPLATDASALHEQLRQLVPASTVRTGTTLRSLEQSRGGVRVEFSDGVREEFDVVVGADGVDSRVRSLLGGADAECCATRHWTVEIPADAGPTDELAEVWTDDVALLYLPGADAGRAWLLADTAPPNGDGTRESDSDAVGNGDETLGRRFESIDWLLPDLLDGREAAVVGRGFDRSVPATTWVDGQVALLGDAAHAVHPVAGVGTALALEDARVMAEELTGRDDALTARLSDYAGRRRSRLRRFQREAGLSARYVATRSPLVGTLHDALALRSHLFGAHLGDAPQ